LHALRWTERQAPSNNDARIQPCAQEDDCDHARRRRLAVRTCDADAVLTAHERAKQLGALDDRDARSLGGHDLRIGFLDRR